MALPATRKTPSKIYDIQAHTSKVTCLDIGETGRVLVTGGLDRNVNLWTLGSKDCFMSLTGHNTPVDCVKFAYSDDFVYSADDSGVIKRWDLNSETECSNFYGHMKSVRTLDFHPYSEYVASGSHDTSIRLWDVRQNVCIKRYRGHISHVNSVRFSPDGFWIASAGTEGSVIVWDIRMSKQLMEFTDRDASPALCVQYHPSDLLMAAGRNDGTVDLYDLEKRQLVSRADRTRSSGHAVRCICFDEGGTCLFVGTAAGVSVIGWEPDQEFDHIEPVWTLLGDMLVAAGKKLMCGSMDNSNVMIHALSLAAVRPFFNPQNQPFQHHQSSRKSFSRGSGKVRLSIGDSSNGGGMSSSGGGGLGTSTNGGMSPNLSIEMIDEEQDQQQLSSSSQGQQTSSESCSFDFSRTVANGSGGSSFEAQQPASLSALSSAIPLAAASGPLSSTNYLVKQEMEMYNIRSITATTTTSTGFSSDLDYYPYRNSSGSPLHNDMIGAGDAPEKEDFPVKNAQPPDYAPKLTPANLTTAAGLSVSVNSVPGATGSKPTAAARQHQVRRSSQTSIAGGSKATGGSNLTRRLATSRSTLELNKLAAEQDPPPPSFKKPISRGSSPIRSSAGGSIGGANSKIRKSESSAQIGSRAGGSRYREHNANVKIEIVTKPAAVARSKTSLDMRARSGGGGGTNHASEHQIHHYSNSSSATMSRAGIIAGMTSNGSISTSSSSGSSSTSTTNGHSLTHIIDLAELNGHATASRGFLDRDSMLMPPPSAIPTAVLTNSYNHNHHYQSIPRYLHEHHHQQTTMQSSIPTTTTTLGLTANEEYEVQALMHEHDTILQALSNREVALSTIRHLTSAGDVIAALKYAVRINNPQILVDLLGSMLEKQSPIFTLDMCVILLPKIYDLLQSELKFHCTRACDTLREILSKFLPLIRENTDPWGGCTIGVDVSREERVSKCIECKTWLLRIRTLPENPTIGSNLQTLQNMMVDL